MYNNTILYPRVYMEGWTEILQKWLKDMQKYSFPLEMYTLSVLDMCTYEDTWKETYAVYEVC